MRNSLFTMTNIIGRPRLYKFLFNSISTIPSKKGGMIQSWLLPCLQQKICGGLWNKECVIKGIYNYNFKDRIDILGVFPNFKVIIEIDTSRADQVGKKMLSRISAYSDEPIIYLAICYMGTKKMSLGECEKYFYYGKHLIERLQNGSFFLGVFLLPNKIQIIY